MNTRRSFFSILAAVVTSPFAALRALAVRNVSNESASPYGCFTVAGPFDLLHSISTPVAPSLCFWRIPEFQLPKPTALGQLTITF